MRELIASDPRGALAASVRVAVRQQLPEVVQAELETRLSGRGGDYLVVARTPAEGNPPAPVDRMIVLGGTRYVAHVYGRRLHQSSKRGASLHGIALDGHLAVHESPLRVLEPGERAAGMGAVGPVTEGTPPAPFATAGPAVAVEAFGRVWELSVSSTDTLGQFEQRLIEREDSAAPDVLPPWIDAETAAASAPSRTLGLQRVLVVPVVSDVPGASVPRPLRRRRWTRS